jgi:hypothetical protein
MPNFSSFLSVSAALIAIGISADAFTPLVITHPVLAQNVTPGANQTTAQPPLSDISSNWASPFIQALATNNIIAGYPDGTFRPYRVVNRANFAAMLQKAFPNQKQVKQASACIFADVPAKYWARAAIQNACQAGIMAGYPGELFRPTKYISKVQAVVALAEVLNLSPSGSPSADLNKYYADAKAIPKYATNRVAAATQAHVVVDYPNVKVLGPNKVISRGEAAALIYQALVAQEKLQPIAANTTVSNYIVGGGDRRNPNTMSNSNNSTMMPNNNQKQLFP